MKRLIIVIISGMLLCPLSANAANVDQPKQGNGMGDKDDFTKTRKHEMKEAKDAYHQAVHEHGKSSTQAKDAWKKYEDRKNAYHEAKRAHHGDSTMNHQDGHSHNDHMSDHNEGMHHSGQMGGDSGSHQGGMH